MIGHAGLVFDRPCAGLPAQPQAKPAFRPCRRRADLRAEPVKMSPQGDQKLQEEDGLERRSARYLRAASPSVPQWGIRRESKEPRTNRVRGERFAAGPCSPARRAYSVRRVDAGSMCDMKRQGSRRIRLTATKAARSSVAIIPQFR